VYLSRDRFRVFSKDYGSIREAKINVLQQGLEKRTTKNGIKVGFYNQNFIFYRTCQTTFFDSSLLKEVLTINSDRPKKVAAN